MSSMSSSAGWITSGGSGFSSHRDRGYRLSHQGRWWEQLAGTGLRSGDVDGGERGQRRWPRRGGYSADTDRQVIRTRHL
jgi:hypothetical protein